MREIPIVVNTPVWDVHGDDSTWPTTPEPSDRVPDPSTAGERIAVVARGLHARGWMSGTAGNVSERHSDHAVITPSGLPKGELRATDMVTIAIADSIPLHDNSLRPSAQAYIHTAIYRACGADAVVHAHPPHATALSVHELAAEVSTIRFAGYELIKALGGNRSGVVDIPAFPNHADVWRIGAEVETYLAAHPDAPPVLFIMGHGITAWGTSLAQAQDRAEGLEALCELTSLTGRRQIAVSDN
ncbi:methylthioribulose 1-phosphate dehydratase [Nocardia heshunensis]